jgi:soluble lytic murein transglycosylase-like protein
MNKASPRAISVRLPTLAALMLVFLGLSTNTHLDAAPVMTLQPELPQPLTPPPLNANDNQIRVLSPRDAMLYRAAFAAQEKGDWKVADDALAQITDKKLVGHVLADRYLRREPTLDEARLWMASYADMPEAGAVYDEAKHLPGFSGAHIALAQNVLSWSGNNGFISTSGFHSVADKGANSQKSRINSKINEALHHGDPIKAREILTTEFQRGTITIDAAREIVGHIAAAFFYQGQIERARPMAHMAGAAGLPLGLWIDGLSAWKQKDYASAQQAFTALAQIKGLSCWDRAAAAYWTYRAASRTGDKGQAQHWLAEAAKSPRSFYGYMAAGLVGQRASRSWKMPELNASNIALLAKRPAGWQALALVQVGRSDLAESELRRLNPVNARETQTAALALAEKAQMPSLTMQLGGIVTNDNGQPFEAALYPVPPWQPAGGFKVDRALIYALMRHESQFDPDAVSERGACGLMQIMPSTAHQIASENRAGRDCPDRLFEPSTNIELGQKYVRILAAQPMIGNNLVLLLAAYNAGPGTLARWLDNDDRADPMLFLESLPAHQTRDYVQKVMLHYWMYRARLSEPETAVAELARGQWPRYALRDESNMRQANAQDLELASIEPVR